MKSYLFDENKSQENIDIKEWKTLTDCKCCLLWVCIDNEEELELAAKEFGLHPISIESSKDPLRRPRIQEFKSYFYANFTLISAERERSKKLLSSDLNMFVGEKFIITYAPQDSSEQIKNVIDEYKESPDLSCKGPMYAVYLLSEDLVEGYYPVIDRLDDESDKLEDEMLNTPTKKSLEKLTQLKSENYELRKLLGPQRDIFSELSRRDFKFIKGEENAYFQDIYNRMIRLFEMLDTIREIQSGSMDIYLSSVNNKLNEIMKLLTIVTVIIGVSALITGFFGMNFKHFPGLDSPLAFWVTLIIMFGVSGLIIYAFKKGWL